MFIENREPRMITNNRIEPVLPNGIKLENMINPNFIINIIGIE